MTEPVIDSSRRDRHELASPTTWLARPLEHGHRLPGTDGGGVSA